MRESGRASLLLGKRLLTEYQEAPIQSIDHTLGPDNDSILQVCVIYLL